MLIYVDLFYSFIREPIKLAILNYFQNRIDFTTDISIANVIITSSQIPYATDKLVVRLSDNPMHVSEDEGVAFVTPMPTNANEMELLCLKLEELL